MAARSLTWSPEVCVLLHPAATFRRLADEPVQDRWTLIRRPLLLAFFLGCAVSLEASGRLSARLVTDGMVAFAFVPIFEMASLALVYRRVPRRVTQAQAMDIFFIANAPWLLWLLLGCIWRSALTPQQASTMLEVPLWVMPLSLIPMAVWTTYVDLQFFREVLSPRKAGRELTLQRVISWTCIVGYFAGHELWEYIALWLNF